MPLEWYSDTLNKFQDIIKRPLPPNFQEHPLMMKLERLTMKPLSNMN